MKTTLNLIKNECANYLGDNFCKIKNYCCLQDKSCNFFNSSEPFPRCTYFETSVLPMDKELEFQYNKERNLSTLNLQKTCKQCLKSFIPKSSKQKFCDECIENRRKEQSRLRMQTKRKVS